MRVFIEGNVPSSKNSKVMTKRGIFHSKTVSKYLQKLGVKSYSAKGFENYVRRPNLFEQAVASMRDDLRNKELPHIIGFHFVRGSRHKFDIINGMQILCDLLVAHGVIEDDNADSLVPCTFPVDGEFYSYNKKKPGVWLDY